jgi:cyclohexa-1,5-dienecarbonyl-CoA hydratase
MSYELIKVSETHDGQVTDIVLGPPPGNIVSAALMKEVSDQIEESNEDKKKKAIVISGEGKHFSFGAAVEEHTPDRINDMLPAFHDMIGRVLNSSVPTVAKVRGVCLGGGFELALACSMIFCEEGAAFGVPEIQLGVFPPPASILLPYKCSESAARRIVLTGDKIGADEAFRLGIVEDVAARGALDDHLSSFLEKHILPRSASSLRLANTAAKTAISAFYGDNIGRVENLYLKELMFTADAIEGIQSFIDKRPAEWKDE